MRSAREGTELEGSQRVEAAAGPGEPQNDFRDVMKIVEDVRKRPPSAMQGMTIATATPCHSGSHPHGAQNLFFCLYGGCQFYGYASAFIASAVSWDIG